MVPHGLFPRPAAGICRAGYRRACGRDPPVIRSFEGEWGFLSNFHLGAFPIAGFRAASGEHAFNALKTVDQRERARVLAAMTPGQAKGIGSRVTLRPGWDEGMRVAAMRLVVSHKFQGGMGERLRLTWPHQLIEGNYWHDNFWGDCNCGPQVQNACSHPGVNMLGELLMAHRATLTGGAP